MMLIRKFISLFQQNKKPPLWNEMVSSGAMSVSSGGAKHLDIIKAMDGPLFCERFKQVMENARMAGVLNIEQLIQFLENGADPTSNEDERLIKASLAAITGRYHNFDSYDLTIAHLLNLVTPNDYVINLEFQKGGWGIARLSGIQTDVNVETSALPSIEYALLSAILRARVLQAEKMLEK